MLPSPSRTHRTTPFAVHLLAACLAIPLLASCKGEQAPKAAPPPPEVRVAKSRAETIPVVRNFVGRVEAFRSVEIRARVEGILEKRHFVEGTDVKKGDLLYSIDKAPFEAALRDAEAALARTEASLANARVREARYGPLAKEAAISQQDYDDALAQLRAAEAEVLSKKAVVDKARLDLGYTSVYATESGRIGLTQVPEGRLVGKGDPTLLATIDKVDPIYVTFTISDRDALQLRNAIASGAIKSAGPLKTTARVFMPDGRPYDREGRLDFADIQVNKDTGTITLRAVLENPKRELVPGLFVRVDLEVGKRPDTVLVPQPAVLKVPTGHTLWVVKADNTIERRDVIVGPMHEHDWIIDKGLAAGETVVVEGVQKVRPEITVRPSPWTPPAEGAAGAVPAAAEAAPAAAPAPGSDKPAAAADKK